MGTSFLNIINAQPRQFKDHAAPGSIFANDGVDLGTGQIMGLPPYIIDLRLLGSVVVGKI